MSGIYWTTNEGKSLLPRQMEDSHIINSIKYFAKRMNSSLSTMDDWEKLAGFKPGMRYVIYEAFVRGLTDPFPKSLTDWANGFDEDFDNYNYPADIFSPL
jgi:hypothetical protein